MNFRTDLFLRLGRNLLIAAFCNKTTSFCNICQIYIWKNNFCFFNSTCFSDLVRISKWSNFSNKNTPFYNIGQIYIWKNNFSNNIFFHNPHKLHARMSITWIWRILSETKKVRKDGGRVSLTFRWDIFDRNRDNTKIPKTSSKHRWYCFLLKWSHFATLPKFTYEKNNTLLDLAKKKLGTVTKLWIGQNAKTKLKGTDKCDVWENRKKNSKT